MVEMRSRASLLSGACCIVIMSMPHLVASLTYEEASSVQFWEDLAPDMHVFSAEYVSTINVLRTSNATREHLRALMKEEGYVELEPQDFYPVDVPQLVTTNERLFQAGIPLPFCFMYDEFWLLYVMLHEVIGSFLGTDYLRLPDFWSWRIDPLKEEKGWGPHRDKIFGTIGEDGLPKSLTVWIPLTDATPLNGCIYLLPANRDPTYNTFSNSSRLESLPWTSFIADFRALPVKAGSVLMWNQQVMHYGSHASKRAASPRFSIAFEFQSSDIKPLNEPLQHPLSLPTVEDRLQLIAKQILQYQHMYRLDKTTSQFAQKIIERGAIRIDGAP